MFKKISYLNPLFNRKITVLFSFLLFANSAYYSYHAIFTPFVPQAVNCRLLYFILIICFLLSFLLTDNQKKLTWGKIIKTFIFSLLPSALIILVGYIKYPENFKDNAQIAANLVIILSSFFIFLKLSKYKNTFELFSDFSSRKELSDEKKEKKNNLAIALIIFLVLAFNIGFGLYHLTEFSAVDEPLWTFDRIPKFWNNFFDGEWHKTRISDKPGITVALISGIGKFWVGASDYEKIQVQGEVTGPVEIIKKINISLRLPILLFNALSLIAIFFLLKKILGRFNASMSIIFIGLSPILLGLSRIINPDSLFWIFSSLSVLSYLIFLKNSEKKYLFLTGIFLGLATLTKYVANFFFVFYFFMIFADFVLNKKSEEWKDYFKKSLGSYATIVYISLITFFIFLPAAWVDLSRITEGTMFSEVFLNFLPAFMTIILILLGEIYLLKGKISTHFFKYLAGQRELIIRIISAFFLLAVMITFVNVWLDMKWFDFEEILASPKSSKTIGGFSGLMLANFYSLIFGIHPLAIIFIIILLIYIIFGKKYEYKIWPTYIILFIFLYYSAYVIDQIGATVRYQIIIYPLAFILSSLGFRVFLFRFHCRKKICFLALIFLILCLIFSLNKIKPFYFSYTSSLLPEKYILNLKDMGDGSYEAAQYLNSLKDAEKLIVWTDKKGVCSFFLGKCFSDYRLKSYTKIDYFVVSAGRESKTQRQRDISAKNSLGIVLEELYRNDDYEYKLEIGGRPNNFIKVFSHEKLVDGKN